MLARAFAQVAAEVAGRDPTADFWYQPIGGAQSVTGLSITPETALSASPVWAATRCLSEPLASLPVFIFNRRVDGGKDRAPTHPVYDLIHTQPNPLQTAYTFWRVLMVHALLWGNAYVLVEPGPRGAVDTLWPLHPDGVRVVQANQSPIGINIPRELVYMVRQPDGREEPINDSRIMHFTGLSLNGISGLSVMKLARESIGLNISSKLYSSKFFGEGGRPSGVLKHPGRLTKPGRTNLRDSWQDTHGGLANMHKVAILEEGMEWQSTGVTSQDAQLLGLLEWSAADCARYFNVPLHMIQETSKVTSWGSGIAELSVGFVTYSLMPWLINIQQAISKDLITSPFFFAEFVPDALLRGDTKTRYEAHQIAGGGQAPWMTRNEIRIIENLDPLPGLDEPLQPANMGPGNRPGPAAWYNPHHQQMIREAAQRAVRKEVFAMLKLDERYGAGDLRRVGAVEQFYSEHPAFVGNLLHLSAAAAREYCAQRQATASSGIELVQSWEAEGVDQLVELALEAQAA